MGEEILMLGDIEVEKKTNFTVIKVIPSFLTDADIERVLVSNKISFGEKMISIFFFYNNNVHCTH